MKKCLLATAAALSAALSGCADFIEAASQMPSSSASSASGQRTQTQRDLEVWDRYRRENPRDVSATGVR